MRSVLVRACVSLVIAAALMPAATVHINFSHHPEVFAPGIDDWTRGPSLHGLVVRATYARPDGPKVFTATWGSDKAQADEYGFAVFTLSLARPPSEWSQSSVEWQYSSMALSPLVSLELDGRDGGVYFDLADPDPGTPGSGPGANIHFGSLLEPRPDGLIQVTYSGAVRLGNRAAEGDLYAGLLIDFGALPFGGLMPQDFQFTQDADVRIPEPSTLCLLGSALAVYGMATRMRRATTPQADACRDV